MSKLVKPREIAQRKQSLRKDSEAKKTEVGVLATRLTLSPEYKWLKEIAKEIAFLYRSSPGLTREEDEAYLTHCKILWAYNKMFDKVESLAKIQQRRETKQNDDTW